MQFLGNLDFCQTILMFQENKLPKNLDKKKINMLSFFTVLEVASQC